MEPSPKNNRTLTEKEKTLIAAARQKCFLLYEGKETPHRSCGIALAETFNLPTPPYQSLRKGGITGCGECGAIMAGRLILGEILGDPDPTGSVTPNLRNAMTTYESLWADLVDRKDAPGKGIICNTLTSQFSDFRGEERSSFCTELAASVAAACAETLIRHGEPIGITPIKGVEGFDPHNP